MKRVKYEVLGRQKQHLSIIVFMLTYLELLEEKTLLDPSHLFLPTDPSWGSGLWIICQIADSKTVVATGWVLYGCPFGSTWWAEQTA